METTEQVKLLDYYKRPEISKSDLVLFNTVGPNKFNFIKQEQFLRLESSPIEESKSLKKGKALHAAILEPKVFKEFYVPVEYETPKSPQQIKFCNLVVDKLSMQVPLDKSILESAKESYSSKNKSNSDMYSTGIGLYEHLESYIDFLKFSKTDEIVILTKKEHEYILGAKDALEKDPVTKDILYHKLEESFVEEEIYWTRGNMDLKSKLDKLDIDFSKKYAVLTDLKTTKAPNPSSFIWEVNRYKIHWQVDYYKHAITWKYPELEKIYNRIVTVELQPPFDHCVYSVGREKLQTAFIEWSKVLEELEWHYINNVWQDKDYYENKLVIIDEE